MDAERYITYALLGIVIILPILIYSGVLQNIFFARSCDWCICPTQPTAIGHCNQYGPIISCPILCEAGTRTGDAPGGHVYAYCGEHENRVERAIKGDDCTGLGEFCKDNYVMSCYWDSNYWVQRWVAEEEEYCEYGCVQVDENTAECNPPPIVCGNGACEEGEDYINCPQDCPPPTIPVCGNGVCETGEDYYTCPQDCPTQPEPPQPVCGNGRCEIGEDYVICPEDCPIVPECTPGDKETYTCPDGTVIVIKECIDGKWVETEETCPPSGLPSEVFVLVVLSSILLFTIILYFVLFKKILVRKK